MLEQVVKSSLLYSFALSQPFSVYVDAYPVLQNKMMMEMEAVQYGELGEGVRVVQEKLHSLQYYHDKIDGEFGVLTEFALKQFQKDHGIDITGRADKESKEKIIENEKSKYMGQLEELADSVRPGMHNRDVRKVQESLRYFGYYEGEIDGIFGPLTNRAMEIASDEHDIPVSDEITGKQHEQTQTDSRDIAEGTENETEPSANKSEEEQDQDTGENNHDEASAAESTEETDGEANNEEEINAEDESPGESSAVRKKTTSHAGAVQAARAMIGTPYAWGGQSESGFDCSGFIQYVYEADGVSLPRTVSDIWNYATPVDSPSVGDLVFFETYKPGPSHMGIYIGDDRFIHAGVSNGVEISELGMDYWKNRYIGAKRVH